MYCKKCGCNNDNNNKFCANCGASLTDSEHQNNRSPNDTIRCPVCGSTNIHFITIQGGQRFDRSDACCGYLLCGPLGFLFGVKDKEPPKTYRQCMNCNHTF